MAKRRPITSPTRTPAATRSCYFSDVKVVSLGDEFVAQPPNSDYPMGGSVLGWPKALDEVLKLDFDTAIPGHGNDPLTKADVEAFQKKIDPIGKKAIELRKKGVAKEQIRAADSGRRAARSATWMMNGSSTTCASTRSTTNSPPPRNSPRGFSGGRGRRPGAGHAVVVHADLDGGGRRGPAVAVVAAHGHADAIRADATPEQEDRGHGIS